MIYIGIDPGKSGAIAFHYHDGCLPQFVLLKETEHDIEAAVRSHDLTNVYAFLEFVRSSPQMGVVSAFTFGRGYGFLHGLLAGLRIPYEEVRPAVWQKELGCLSGGDKQITKVKAQQMWPNGKWTHANSDAALIAEYGRRTLNMRKGQ